MAGSTRIKGVALKLTLGTPGTDYWADVTSCKIGHEDADKDTVTFADAAEGGQQGKLVGSAVQSTATASLWSYIWENSGEVVAFTHAPHGNAIPTADQPHFVGMVKIGNKPEIGGDAGAENTYTFDFEWKIEGAVTIDRGE